MKWIGFVVLLAFGLGLVLYLDRRAETLIVAIHEPEQVAPAADPDQVARDAAYAMLARDLAKANQKLAAMAEETRQIEEIVLRGVEPQSAPAEPATPPTPVTGYAPTGARMGNKYSNENLKPVTGDSRVIIDFTPERANSIEWQEAIRSGRCGGFSFVDAAGKTVNRLYCDAAVAR